MSCHLMNDLDGEVYNLLPDEIVELATPVIKLTADTYNGENNLIETEDKFWIKSEKETYGRNIYSAPGEGHWYEWYRQEDVPWHKMRNGNNECTMLRSPNSNYSGTFCVVNTNGQREQRRCILFPWARPGFLFLINKSNQSAPQKWCVGK